MEVLIQAGDDALGSNARREALLLGVAIGEDLLTQGLGPSLLGAVGRGDEGVEAGLDEEAAQVADAAGAGLVEAGMRGENEAAEEAFAGWALEEGSPLGLIGAEVVAVLLSSDPVVEGGVRDAGMASELASGGVGLLGMWKAFEEMEALGWIGSERPKMIVAQAAGCAPVVKAWESGQSSTEMWTDAATLAAGLRVPKPYGDYLILDILKKSGGTAVSATDIEIVDAVRHWARVEGIFAAPEGAASLVAYRKLRDSGFFKADDTVVLFNTGSGLKYLEVLDAGAGRAKAKPAASARPAARQIGGIIGPY